MREIESKEEDGIEVFCLGKSARRRLQNAYHSNAEERALVLSGMESSRATSVVRMVVVPCQAEVGPCYCCVVGIRYVFRRRVSGWEADKAWLWWLCDMFVWS